MRPILFFSFMALAPMLFSQAFTEYPPPPLFEGFYLSSVAFSDVNGDGAEDLLITGATGQYSLSSSSCPLASVTKLYLNDGTGRFTEMPNTPFEDVLYGTGAFSDVNGDGFEDVLITGLNNSNEGTAKLYTNDGTGTFIEIPDTPFEGVSGGSIAFSDVNGDGFEDVLISGWNDSNEGIAKLYTKDENGNFSEMPDNFFEEGFNSIALSDVNGDDASDILVLGNGSSKLYINDGEGNFSEMPAAPFEGFEYASIAFSDIDGNNTSDVLLVGRNSSYHPLAKLYINNGTGAFTEKTDTSFQGITFGSSIAFSDIDGNGTPDVLIAGENELFPSTKLYLNDGEGNFFEMPDNPFIEATGPIAFSDVNGDGHEDVFLSGATVVFFIFDHPIAKLYINDGDGGFSEMMPPPFECVDEGSIAFSDVNGDGTSDLLITGSDLQYNSTTKLYTNDGNGNFTEMPDTPFEGVSYSSVAFSDVNGDGTSDVLITGEDIHYNATTKLYMNNGNGNFTEVPDTPFEGVDSGSIAFSDINGDDRPDVLITGYNSSWILIAKLYLNNGNGNFSEVPDTPFEGVGKGSVAFSDVNGDGSEDVLITGSGISKLYINNGNGEFSEVMDTPFEGVNFSSVGFSDIDGNGTSDVIITGRDSSNTAIAKLYINRGDGDFIERPDIPFEGVFVGSLGFSDINGDGLEDVLITGYDNSSTLIAKLYINNGMGNFYEMIDTSFIGVAGSAIAFSDVNGDGKPDVFVSGRICSTALISKLYINEGTINSTSERKAEKKPNAMVYPNPNSEGSVFIEYASTQNATLQISLFDLSGRMVQQFTTGVSTGLNSIPFETSVLPKGMYFFRLDDGIFLTTLKVIVQ